MLLGIDIGSTGMKAALYTQEGRLIQTAYQEYAIRYGSDGEATINLSVWSRAFQDCLQELSQNHRLDNVSSIGISGANAMILTDDRLNPIFPVIMQLDKRGHVMVDTIASELGDEYLFQKTGNRNAPGYQWGPTLKYLQCYQADPFAKVRMIFHPTSYFVMYLTGTYCMDRTRASTTLLYNAETGDWDPVLWEYFGLAEVAQPVLTDCMQFIGYTRPGLCIPAGIPVASGGIDTICAMLGLTGGQEADCLILGSVGRFAVRVLNWDKHFLNTVSWNGQHKISMTPVNNAGTALKWLKQILFSQKELGYSEIVELAASIPPGSDGLCFLPYLNGSSCPHWNDSIRGAFLGLESYHTPAHMVRAVLEGVSLSLEENQAVLLQCGCTRNTPLYVGGGGVKSDSWCQIISDILGRELLRPMQTETETMGAAMLGGLAAKILCTTNLSNWNPIQKRFYPIPAHIEDYKTSKEIFAQAYQSLSIWSKFPTVSFSDFSTA